MKCQLLPCLGALRLVELNHATLDSKLMWPLQSQYSVAHVRLVFGVLKVAFKQAASLGLIGKNPMADMTFTDFIKTKIKPKDAVRLIEEYHTGIAHLFKAGRIGEIQYLESETLITALEMLRVDGVVALPIHDAILIPASSLEVGKRAMDNAALKVLGISIPTSHGLL